MSGSRSYLVLQQSIASVKASARVMKDAHVLEILLVQCVMLVVLIGTETNAVCSLGLANFAMAKEDVCQILRNASVKNNLQE
jgi:hypothetical protein